MESILSALVYADIFDYPLTKDEIWQWQIKTKEKVVKYDQMEAELQKLLTKGICDKYQKYFFLKGRKRLVNIRKQREKWSNGKTKIADKIAKILFYIPWIELIGISGGVARKNADKQDDIDFFIIVKDRRLWLTRGLVALILKTSNLYRRPGKVKDMICPNMYLSKKFLNVYPHDLYVSHEICLMKPLVERHDTYRRFIAENRWIKDYLPNAPAVKIVKKIPVEHQSNGLFIVDLFEKIVMAIELKYMEKHKTKEIVSSGLIKFHPGDVREKILSKYNDKRDYCFK